MDAENLRVARARAAGFVSGEAAAPCGKNGQKKTNGKPANQPENWRYSGAKKFAVKLIKDDTSWIYQYDLESAAGVRKVHEREPMFKQYPFQRFRTNFATLKSSIQKEEKALKFDREAFEKEKIKFPKKTHTRQGYRMFPGSEAEALLKRDIQNGKHLKMKPKDLRDEEDAYNELPLGVFRNHLYRTERYSKEDAFWQDKRNKNMRRKKVAEEKRA